MSEFNDLLNKACHLYDELNGVCYPIWRRGHHEFCTDLMHEYEISVKLLDDKTWHADCVKFGTTGTGSCLLTAVFNAYIAYYLHR